MQATEYTRREARTARRSRAKDHEEQQSKRGESNVSIKIASVVDRVRPCSRAARARRRFRMGASRVISCGFSQGLSARFLRRLIEHASRSPTNFKTTKETEGQQQRRLRTNLPRERGRNCFENLLRMSPKCSPEGRTSLQNGSRRPEHGENPGRF